MGRMLAVSYKPYRRHQLEMRDAGGTRCAVIIHPPQGRGAPQEVIAPEGVPARLGTLVQQAKQVIDAVLGPRPPVSPSSGYGSRRG